MDQVPPKKKGSKATLILFSVFIILIALIGIKKYMQFSTGKIQDQESHVFQDASAAMVTSIIIKSKEKETMLKKDGETWKVASEKDFEADKDMVETIFQSLQDAQVSSIASRTRDKSALFEVDGEKGTTVTLLKGEEKVKTLVIGKPGPDYQSSYVLIDDRPEIYLIKGDFDTAFKAEDFRNKKLFAFQSDEIKEVTFTYPKEKFTVKKDGEAWKEVGHEDVSLDPSKVGALTEKLAGLEAVDFPADEKPRAVDPGPTVSVTIKVGDKEEKLIIGAKAGENYYATNTAGWVYFVPEYSVSEMTKHIGDLK